jgi:hypothetical protein
MLAAMRRASSRGEELGRCAASWLVLEIDVGERLPVELRPLNPHHAEARVGIVVDDQDQTGW